MKFFFIINALNTATTIYKIKDLKTTIALKIITDFQFKSVLRKCCYKFFETHATNY